MTRESGPHLFLLVLLLLLQTTCNQFTPALPTLEGPPATPLAGAPARPTGSESPQVQPTFAPAATQPLAVAPTGLPSPATPALPIVQQHFALNPLPGIGRAPYSIAAVGSTLYVVNSGSNNVAVVQDNRVARYIAVGKRPGAIVADPAQKRLYVANQEDKSLSLISGDTVTLTQNLGDEPSSLLFFENRLWVGSGTEARIFILDPATLKTQSTITLNKGFDIMNLAGDAVRHRVYAMPYERLAVVDSTNLRVLSIVDTKGSFYTLLALPASGSVMINTYEPKANLQYLTARDPLSGAERARAPIGGDPRAAVMSADGTRVYVANSYTNDVSVIDPQVMILIATIPVDLRPYGLALDESAHLLYVANYGSDNINIVDTTSYQVTGTIPLGMIPTALESNEEMGRIYVASASTDSVYVVEATRIVKEIPVGRHPIDLARDEQSNRLLVANAADRTLSIIDESDFSVRATQPITHFLTTVAVDPARERVLAGDVVLDLKTLKPIDRLIMQGATIGSQIAPDWVRVNPNTDRIYALGWNGTPGSNSREVTYNLDGKTLKQIEQIGYYGNTTALAIDPEMNRVFIAGTHPLMYSNELGVFDAANKKLLSLSLPGRTPGMLYNPQTHHLFLSQVGSYFTGFGSTPTPTENVVLVLDSNSFGSVARLVVASPGKMARLGDTIYVASRDDGSLTMIQDTNVATPPSPTPTLTPTPYPTFAPSTATRIVSPSNTPRAAATLPICAIPVTPLAARLWTPQVAARLGCPTELQRQANFAVQPFERGTMYWREDEKQVYVLYSDNAWSVFDDKWTAALPEDSCPNISVASGRIKPKRGFGKVWCEQSAVSAKLGAATGNEMGGYLAPVQRFERGAMVGTESGQLLVLYSDGKWE